MFAVIGLNKVGLLGQKQMQRDNYEQARHRISADHGFHSIKANPADSRPQDFISVNTDKSVLNISYHDSYRNPV